MQSFIRPIHLCFVSFFLLSANESFSLFPKTKPPVKVVPIEKFEKQPILKVIDPITSSKVFIVGVSHGASYSSNLVREVIEDVKPSVIVLELCHDRFMSICVDNNIEPYGNKSWTKTFQEFRYNQTISSPSSASLKNKSLQRTLNAAKFIYAQGFIGGFFVLLSFLGTTTQLLAAAASERVRSTPTVTDSVPSKRQVENEFATAIRLASANKIPIRLGDATQYDTLRSLDGVLSIDILNPVAAFQNGKNLVCV